MPKKTIAYKCSFCKGKFYKLTKKSVENHEKICLWNPERQSCLTCKHFLEDSETIFSNHCEENDTETFFNYCDKGVTEDGRVIIKCKNHHC